MSIFDRFRAPDSEENNEYLKEGEIFGEYKVLEILSYSIIGVLYRAEQRVSLRQVCILVMPSRTSTDPRFGDRFRKLVGRVQELDHPGLLTLRDGAIINRRYVLIFEPIDADAVTLEQYPELLNAGKIPHSEHPFTLEGQQEKDARNSGAPPPRKAMSGTHAPSAEARGAERAPAREGKNTGSSRPPALSRIPFLSRNPLGINLSRSKNVGVPYERAAPIFRQVLEVLKYVHSEGMDHLSLTPSTILYFPDGSIKVFAVGLTHALEKELFERIVSADIVPIQIGPRKVRLNTIDMFSPEIRGGQAYRASSDIYGVGVLFYYTLTGKKPSMGKYQSPREFVPDLPGNWDLFLYKSLDTNPKSRYPTISSQLSDFIKINQPEKQGSNNLLAAQLERIPVPSRIRERGETVTLVWRLSMIGLVGVVLVGGLAALLPGYFRIGPAGERKIAYRSEADAQPNLVMRFTPQRVRVEFDEGDTKFIVLDGELDLVIKRGTHRMIVSAPNHHPREMEVQVGSNPLGPMNIRLSPQWSRLLVRGTPGATLYATDANGRRESVGTIPEDGELLVDEGLFSGTYDIEAVLENYEPARVDDVVLPLNEQVELAMELQPLPASVEVVSEPSGARVFINGEPSGETPLELEGLPVNRDLEFALRRDGYRERVQTLNLRPNSSVLLDFGNLIMKTGEVRPSVTLNGRAPTPGLLQDLTYLVDGVEFPGTAGVLAPIMEGEHTLEVRHPDYFTSRTDIRVGDGRFTPVAVDLEPKPGQLTVRLSPPLAFQLLADGEPVRPIDGAGSSFALRPGREFEVEVRIRDHLTARRTLRMNPNEKEVWSITPLKIPGPENGEAYRVPYLGASLVPIAPGSFSMGSPLSEPSRLPTEGPQTAVTLGYPFWMGQYEITQSEFIYIMEENPSNFKGPDHPVDSVTWREADAFCERLTAIESQAGRLPAGYVYRLPTEPEWEYAARAGTQTPFHWGDRANPANGNFKGVYPRDFNEDQDISSIYGSVPVGSYRGNAWGLFDMHGNLREWTANYWNARLPGGSLRDFMIRPRDSQRAVRGGGWEDSAQRCRSAERIGFRETIRSDNLGFRVVLAPPIPRE